GSEVPGLPVSLLVAFFFSSRRRHTRCLSDWSSDVCSSDLPLSAGGELGAFSTPPSAVRNSVSFAAIETLSPSVSNTVNAAGGGRSEERRVGKERGCRRWRSREKSRSRVVAASWRRVANVH